MSFLEQYTKEDRIRNQDIYNSWMLQNRPDGWLPDEKEENYSDLSRIICLTGYPLEGASCLDVGCGSGDLSEFLKRQKVTRYLGVDLYEPAILLAREKYPNEEFVLQDFLTFETAERFDYAFLSGAISLQLESDNHALVRALVAKMWNFTRVGFAMNFFTDYDPWVQSNPNIRFHSIPEIEGLCKEVVPTATIAIYDTPNRWQANVYVYRPTAK